MPIVQAGPYPIPGATMPTWLVRFDKDGVCTSPQTAAALVEHLRTGNYTNVLFYSHGWNTDFTAAVDQYSSFLIAFQRVMQDHPLNPFRPIFVGVTWPSVWMPSTPGPQLAGIGDGDSDEQAATLRDQVIADIATGLNPDQREELYLLTDQPTLDRDQALRLAQLIAPIVSRTPDAAEGGDDEPIDAEGVLKLASALRIGETPPPQDADLDQIGTVGAAPTGSLGAAGEGWDPTDLVKLASLYQMKDRAGRVGTRGVSVLLRNMLAATQANGAKVHVFGHSFGAKVMLSAICAPQALPQEPASLLLLQPAISHLCFATNVPGRGGEGGYRAALDRVQSPIFSTFSSMDFPLHKIFHLALRRPADLGELRIAADPDRYAALGGYGPRGAGEHAPVSPIPAPSEPYPDFGQAKLVGLNGSAQRITSHGDVANRYTAWALRTQIERSRS